MIRRPGNCLALAAALSMGLAGVAHAEPRVLPGSFEVGAGMGGYFFVDSETGLKDTFDYGLAVNANFTEMLGAQIAFGTAPREVNPTSFYQLHVDFIVHPLEHEWLVPFVGVGPTFSFAVPKDGARDSDPALNLLAGVDLYPFEHVGFRLDARYIARFGAGADAITAHDMIATFGLIAMFGGEKDEGPILLDTDGDGILDSDDACPTVPGVPSAQGCPDKDGDTLPDDKDRCPDDAGPVELRGCPDKDGDGIANLDDRCPDDKGAEKHKGCPDADGDDIVDLDDRCPKIPGEVAYQGCPPPPPKEIVEKFSGTIEGINFEYNSDVIKAESFPILDEAVAVMVKYPQLRILIEGHTSAEGDRVANLDLSQRRAESVKRYMTEKSVDADRVETQGFGPDRPVADNKNKKGRELNRRIEFKILQQ